MNVHSRAPVITARLVSEKLTTNLNREKMGCQPKAPNIRRNQQLLNNHYKIDSVIK